MLILVTLDNALPTDDLFSIPIVLLNKQLWHLLNHPNSN